MPIASSAPRASSSSTSTGVPAVKPSTLVDSSWSDSARTPASTSSSRMGTPTNLAVEMSPPPTSLDTHARVIARSTSGRRRMSSKDRFSSRSTMPCTRSRHSSASTRGRVSAVSIR